MPIFLHYLFFGPLILPGKYHGMIADIVLHCSSFSTVVTWDDTFQLDFSSLLVLLG